VLARAPGVFTTVATIGADTGRLGIGWAASTPRLFIFTVDRSRFNFKNIFNATGPAKEFQTNFLWCRHVVMPERRGFLHLQFLNSRNFLDYRRAIKHVFPLTEFGFELIGDIVRAPERNTKPRENGGINRQPESFPLMCLGVNAKPGGGALLAAG